MLIKLKDILYLPIIFLFLPAFVILIPALGGTYQCFFLVLYACFVICFCSQPINFLKKIYSIVATTPLKWFALFLLLASIDSICISFLGNGSIVRTIRYIFVYFILYIIPTILYFLYIIEKYISFERFIRIFIILIWSTLVLGLIAFTGQLLNITFINNLFDFLANWRLINPNDYYNFIGEQLSHYEAFGLPRLNCLQQEPSYYGRWLFLFLPFIYYFSGIKVPILKNHISDSFLKKTLIPFAWISIILTFSPVYLILCLILTFIMYFKPILYILKKHFVRFWAFCSIAIILLFVIFSCSNFNLSESYISRIFNVLLQVRSFEDFIKIESSLATRIICFINMFCVFVKHPFFGVGLGNIGEHLMNSFLKSPVPLTYELIGKFKFAIIHHRQLTYNNSMLFELLSNYGFIISSIFFYFCYCLFKNLNQILINSITLANEYLAYAAISIKWCLIALLIVMFYSSSLVSLEVCTIIFIAVAAINKANLMYVHNKEVKNKND